MTIKDLSAQTGYSVGTVSRVLNNLPNVSDKAREIILQAARESGFQFNANARQLRQHRGDAILVVVKGVTNGLFSPLVQAIQARVAATGQPLLVDFIDEMDNEVRRAVQLCLEKKPIGILFLGGDRENFLSDFQYIHVPSVLVTNSAGDLPFENLSSVSSDDILAARMAIDHLVGLGHRKIVVIGGDRQVSDITRLRCQGCLAAFREHGIPFDEAQDYETTRFSYADGYKAVKRLLSRGREFTALFAMSDVMAIGAIRALKDAGRRVPEDVSVMGLDGLTIGEYTIPRLATVAQSVDALAVKSLELLRASLEGDCAPRCETVSVTLHQKESAAAI